MTTSPGPATGSGRSPYFKTSGPPYCSMKAAFIAFLRSISRRQPHQHLAEVLALQQAEERRRRILQPVDDILAVFDAAAADPLARLAQEIGLLCGEIRDDEAAQEEALTQDREHVRPRHRCRHVVLRDQPADGNASEIVEQRPDRLLHAAADVLEIDVDPLAAGGLELLGKIRSAMIDAGVEAEFVRDEAAFLGAAGDAHGTASLDLGDLSDHRADGA